MKIVFPEINNRSIAEAISHTNITPIGASDLEDACAKINNGEADAMIAGLDYSSRDVILACKNYLGMSSQTFSSCMVFDKPAGKRYIVADIATCKNPTEDQLYDIVCQTYLTAKKLLSEDPKVALLSFSTLGSGGHDESMTKIQNVVRRVQLSHPEINIDGELQLDAAIVPKIARKKAPESSVAGVANVLICPDINSGNILYKSMEYFGEFSAAGPILQGFNFPVSDLSRGSSVADIVKSIEILQRISEA